MEFLPKDPVMLLSFVNMKLRDQYPNADELCRAFGISAKELDQTLQSIGYTYDPDHNQYR